MSDLLDPRIAAWIAPIPGGAPSGIDARYEPLHEAIRGQIALLDAVAGGEVDWDRVRTDAGRLLSTTSKDLLVASYLAFALFKLEGLRGLAIGVQAIARMSDAHWDGMFPPAPRARARVNAIDWR
jgi:predicted component of type VI protein secretion system